MQEKYGATTKMHQNGGWWVFSKARKYSSYPVGPLGQNFCMVLTCEVITSEGQEIQVETKKGSFSCRLRHAGRASSVPCALQFFCWSMLPRAAAASPYRARKYRWCDLRVPPVTLGQLINFFNQIYIMQIALLLFAENLPHSSSLHLMHSQKWPEGIML